MRKVLLAAGILVVLLLVQFLNYKKVNELNNWTQDKVLNNKFQDINNEGRRVPGYNIPKLEIDHDQDNDGINDLDDILEGARKDAENKPQYRSAYYSGGYPPGDEGVCTDVIWRAFRNAGYNLKDMVDKDIEKNMRAYPRVETRQDPNIDFRRVPNLVSFFKRNAQVLTTELIPHDVQNLGKWQGGDIVVFGRPLEHIGIVSDIRRKDGVPYMVHNAGPYTREEDAILYWHEKHSRIIGHYRWPKEE